MQWKHSDLPSPRKFWTQPPAGKVIASVFSDSKGLLSGDREKARIAEPRCVSGMTMLRHESRVAQATISGWTLNSCLTQPTDVAPSDIDLFRVLKFDLRGKCLNDDKVLKAAVDHCFELSQKTSSFCGIAALKFRRD